MEGGAGARPPACAAASQPALLPGAAQQRGRTCAAALWGPYPWTSSCGLWRCVRLLVVVICLPAPLTNMLFAAVPPQAHMENMNVVGQGLDERGRRPWEGSSRTDIRSGGGRGRAREGQACA